MAINARNCRVFLDGHDISRYVRSLNIEASVTGPVTTTLELLVMPTWDADGNINLGSGVTSEMPESPVSGLFIRAMELGQ
jgi:hypothetical protein